MSVPRKQSEPAALILWVQLVGVPHLIERRKFSSRRSEMFKQNIKKSFVLF
jgi:hypothetical protein